MKKFSSTIICLSLLYSCSHTHTEIDYKKYDLYSSENAGNQKYEEIGPVNASISGFAWDNCQVLATKTVEKLVSEAKARGATAIMNVKWERGDTLIATPNCKNALGWFVLYIVGGLGPWVQTVGVSGTAIKYVDKNISDKKSDNIFLPKNKSSLEIATEYFNKKSN